MSETKNEMQLVGERLPEQEIVAHLFGLYEKATEKTKATKKTEETEGTEETDVAKRSLKSLLSLRSLEGGSNG